MGVVTVTSEDLGQVVGFGGQLSMLDKKLLKYASQGRTPNEMAEKLGGMLTPAQCAQRSREILSSLDWLAIVERRALILMDMIELKEILMQRVRQEGGTVEDDEGRFVHVLGDPRWAANATKILSEMNKLISNEKQAVDAERQGLRKSHAMVMVRALEMAFDKMSRDLRAEYPQVPEARIRAAMEDAVPLAITTIDAAILDDDRVDDEGGF